MIYTAEHASLAVLEVLVHLESSHPLAAYSLIQAEFECVLASTATHMRSVQE